VTDKDEKNRRPYEPPRLVPVDLVKLRSGSRMASATPGYVIAQAPVSTSNVTGGVVFGSKDGPPDPEDPWR